MGTGCPPPVYVRVRRYGWRRREHAWTGGRVHRGPGAIATMMHAAARFKLISGSQVRALVRPPSLIKQLRCLRTRTGLFSLKNSPQMAAISYGFAKVQTGLLSDA